MQCLPDHRAEPVPLFPGSPCQLSDNDRVDRLDWILGSRTPLAVFRSNCMSQSIEERRINSFYFVINLAFPQYVHAPSQGSQLVLRTFVTRNIGVNLASPKHVICEGHLGTFTSVLMPKAPVYQHDRSPFAQNDVGSTRKLRIMKAKPETTFVHRSPDGALWFCIATPDCGHNAAAHLRGDIVHFVVTVIEGTIRPSSHSAQYRTAMRLTHR
jgi:hypothetical protein